MSQNATWELMSTVTIAEDDAICILEFGNGAVGLVENSWARRGGMRKPIDLWKGTKE